MKLITIAVLAVVLGAAVAWNAQRQPVPLNALGSAPDSVVSTNAADKKILYYTCPMHPSVKSDKPGNCPDCGMKLQPVYASETNSAAAALPGCSGCCGGGACQ